MLNTYVAFLRALYQIHQNNHWLCSGDNFYSNHLLFQRLYDSTLEDVDGAAEKVIGIFQDLDVNPAIIASIVSEFCPENFDGNMVKCSLEAEKAFLELSRKVYLELESSDELTLGLDDFIMATASKHEEHVYLLSQALVMG